jgi:hypothetical protein
MVTPVNPALTGTTERYLLLFPDHIANPGKDLTDAHCEVNEIRLNVNFHFQLGFESDNLRE